MDANTLEIDVDKYPNGIITSENYPAWEEQTNYTVNLVSSNPNKFIKFYLTDMFIEDNKECDKAYLEFDDKVSLK